MNLHLLAVILAAVPMLAVGRNIFAVRRSGIPVLARFRLLASDLGDIANVPAELKGKTVGELRAIADYLRDALRDLDVDSEGHVRMLSDDEQKAYDEGFALRTAAVKLLERHAQIASLATVPEHVESPARREAPAAHLHRDSLELVEDRSVTPRQLSDATVRELEAKVDAEFMPDVQKIVKRHARDERWVRSILARSTDTYAEKFLDAIRGIEAQDEYRTVLGVTTNANGKLLLPTHLDPTIIMTNASTNNIVRQLARKATLTQGTTWHGITSAGVTASWDGEVVEVSDDTPTVSGPSVSVNRAQAFVQASLSAVEDIDGLAGDVLMMFAESRDVLEGTGFVTGSGSSNQPRGIFTALNANGAVQVTSTTGATIGLVDLNATYIKVPRRFRGKGAWLMHPNYLYSVKSLGTALSASYSTNLTEAPADRIFNRPVYDSDDCPSTQTTTALDNEIVYGDFSNYLIVDKPGSSAIQYIPTLFNLANNLPDGRVGWYMTWRTGGDSLVDTAFALLVDKTTA